MKAYRIVRRWVDQDLARGGQPAAMVVLVAILPLMGVPILGEWWLAPSLCFAVVWVSFAGWRGWRIFKTGLIDSDSTDWVEPR